MIESPMENLNVLWAIIGTTYALSIMAGVIIGVIIEKLNKKHKER